MPMIDTLSRRKRLRHFAPTPGRIFAGKAACVAAAQQGGKFNDELAPITTIWA